MKILVVQESDWLERGPHQSHHLMERMVQRGHEVRVIDFEIDWRKHIHEGLMSARKEIIGVHKVVEDGGVTVIRPFFIRLPLLIYLTHTLSNLRELERQLDEYKPDVIVGFGIINSAIAIYMAKKKSIPFIYYIIDELHRLVPEKIFQKIAKALEVSNVTNSDQVLVINEGLKDYAIEMGANETQIKVIRAGVDIEKFWGEGREKIRSDMGFKNDDIILFFMGWLYDFSGLKEVGY